MGIVSNDNYPTPQDLANAITKFCFELFPEKQLLIEPACGAGNFIRAMRAYWPLVPVVGIDLVGDYAGSVQALGATFTMADFLTYAPILGPLFFRKDALVLTNPPYDEDLPQRFIEVISQNAEPGCHIAFLLRQSFLGGIGRALKFKERKSLRIKRDVAGRPKFDPNSKTQDHSEYGVFIYEVGYSGHYIGWEDPLIWKPSHLKKLAALQAA